MKRIALMIISAFFIVSWSQAQDLKITTDDLKIEQGVDGGYHLWIKKRADIESVLLTESTKDPEGKLTVYSLRNPEYHPVNGDEQQLLNGEFLDRSKDRFTLIDSTVEVHPELGEAFHIYIPYIIVFGYPWALRSGELMVLDGTYLSIRAFEKTYADYTGAFLDNPFVVRVTQKPLEGPPEGNYMADTVDDFSEIAEENDGEIYYSTGEEDMVDTIEKVLDRIPGGTLDLVLALDTTQSMSNDIPYLQEKLVPLLEDQISRFESFRIGLVYYRDYMEEYVTRTIPFHEDFSLLQKDLKAIRVAGGRDIPEAVFEALYAGVVRFPWAAEARRIILIGDAPPHPRPRGRITKEVVFEEASKGNIRIETIILPQ